MDAATQQLLRDLTPRVLGALMRRYRDLQACEDAVQEALIAAAESWPRTGLPNEPRGWLIHVANRRIADATRAETARRLRESIVVSLVPPEEQLAHAADVALEVERDDSLHLLFLCCQPALSTTSAIALTLRSFGGLTTAEIARAFLVPEATMAQRLSRARQTLKTDGLVVDVLPADWTVRLKSVMHVLYLVFSEGYVATSGPDLHRVDLSTEAIRLTRALHRLAPAEAEVQGLLALMLLTDARRAARTSSTGSLVPLDQQDRSTWDAALITEGTALVTAAMQRGTPGPYQLQAAIAALHDEAPSADATDWPQIAALYEVLLSFSDNPLVALNQAIAVAMVDGPEAGLARVDAISKDPRLAGNHRVDATRGHLLERAGRLAEAATAFRLAAARTTSAAERDYLLLQAARLGEAL